MARQKSSRVFLLRVFSLTLSDLAHDWRLTLCLVLSLGAVFAPMLILLGLKDGIIHTMLADLARDPMNREIIPDGLLPFKADNLWFRKIAERSDVAFIIPNLRGLGMTLEVKATASGLHAECDARPSGPSDPLLSENGVQPPSAGEAVLSQPLAARLHAVANDKVEVTVIRRAGGGYEDGSALFRVSGVARDRATNQETIWLPLGFLEDVEVFLVGGSVPRLAWKGRASALQPRFDGVLLATSPSIPTEQIPRLSTLSGFGIQEALSAKQFALKTGITPKDNESYYLWRAVGNTVDPENIEKLQARLTDLGIRIVAIPWVDDLSLEVSDAKRRDANRQKLPVHVIDPLICRMYSESKARDLDPSEIAQSTPPQSQTLLQPLGDKEILMSNRDPLSACEAVLATARLNGKEIEMELHVRGSDWLPPGNAGLTANLAGQLCNARNQNVRFEKATGEFVPVTAGYRDFRLYATELDAIAPLVDYFKKEGIPVRSNQMAVHRVRLMEKYMDTLYRLIVTVSAVAGISALLASLYANVQRKRVAIAYLELIGLDRRSMLCFPIYQSLIIVGLAIASAFGAYFSFSWILSMFFSTAIPSSEPLCLLVPARAGVFCCAALTLAALVACVSAVDILRLDPAEHIRKE